MLQRTYSSFVIVLLAGCQSVPFETRAHGVRIDQIEHGFAELKREIAGVRNLLGARGMQPTRTDSQGVDPLDALELQATLAILNDRVDRLHAGYAAAGAKGTVDASHSIEASLALETKRAAAIGALRESLVVLEESHALHCENIAHLDVPGYKRRFARWTSELDDAVGVRIPASAGIKLSLLQGVLELTGNSYDFAIEGRGFFEIQLHDGSLRYTRNGAFRSDFDGRIVTAEGFRLTDQITVPSSVIDITTSDDGQVFGLTEGHQLKLLGRIRRHVFSNPDALEVAAPRGFTPTALSGPPLVQEPGTGGFGRIRQGYIERANVNINRELIDMQLIERQADAIRRALADYGVYTR